jgi:thioredoxin 1
MRHVMSNVMSLTEADFDREVFRSEVPVLVDYWAPWCHPCRVVAPVLERIAEEREGSLKVVKVNVDEEPQLADLAGVHGIPFLVLHRDGQAVAQMVGAHPKHTIELALNLDPPAERAA